jgi:two-component system, response regulator PdtaR
MVVLVVEDEAIIAHSSAAELEDAGHAVLGPAHSSAEALALARVRDPDVALVDINLEAPGAGVRLARQLRAQYDTVVVFTTAQKEVARAHADNAIGVLAKPYDPTELTDVVEYAESVARGGRQTKPPAVRSFERFAHRGTVSRSARDRSARDRSYRCRTTAGAHD